MVFLKQMLDKTDFKSLIHSCKSLPFQNSNRAHDIDVILETFMTSVWCGANRFLHTEITRHDKALGKIFNWKTCPGQDAYKRYFSKFDASSNIETAKHFFQWFFKNIHLNHFTLDINSTVVTRYGQLQEGAKRGFNPNKRGRKSHHPNYCICQ